MDERPPCTIIITPRYVAFQCVCDDEFLGIAMGEYQQEMAEAAQREDEQILHHLDQLTDFENEDETRMFKRKERQHRNEG
jgi:hypothetical protein